jgi:transposase
MNTKLHAVTDADGRPVRFFMTPGQVSDYTGAATLLGSLPKAEWLLADRRYDADWFREVLKDKGIKPCIPGRKSRGKPIKHDKRRYKRRNRIGDHVWAAQGLAAGRNTLRQMPEDIPLRRRPRRNNHVLAMMRERDAVTGPASRPAR